MATNPKLSNVSANAAVDAVCVLANSGYIRIYDAPQPATADTAISTQTLLAELRFGSTAFGAAVAGVATANSITADSSANASGAAAWFRVLKSDGTTVLWDGSIGTSGCDLNLDSTSIALGGAVTITAFTYTQSKG